MAGIGKVRELAINGVIYPAKSGWTINVGRPMREGVAGDGFVHGFTETAQVPFVEGPITVTKDVNVSRLLALTDATVVIVTGDQKRYTLRSAWWAGEGEITTDEGEIAARFEATVCDIQELGS